jgi:hypothetical protein
LGQWYYGKHSTGDNSDSDDYTQLVTQCKWW